MRARDIERQFDCRKMIENLKYRLTAEIKRMVVWLPKFWGLSQIDLQMPNRHFMKSYKNSSCLWSASQQQCCSTGCC